MSIVFSGDGLKDAAVPCIAQTFVNHNAQLFKIYVLGKEQFVVKRPSIKNIYAGSKWRLLLACLMQEFIIIIRRRRRRRRIIDLFSAIRS